jgi:hypothetical protein
MQMACYCDIAATILCFQTVNENTPCVTLAYMPSVWIFIRCRAHGGESMTTQEIRDMLYKSCEEYEALEGRRPRSSAARCRSNGSFVLMNQVRTPAPT